MSTLLVRKKEIHQPSFTAIYVWQNECDEEFESYVKKNMMLTLGWAARNDELQEFIHLNNGDTDQSASELVAIFKKEFNGNISYLQDIIGIEITQMMVETIKSFIVATVTNNSKQFTNILR